MELLRRVAAVAVGVWVGLSLGRIVSWIFGLDDGLVIVAFVVGGLLGLLCGTETARTLKPWDSKDRRDALIGWGIVGGLIAVIGLIALVGSL